MAKANITRIDAVPVGQVEAPKSKKPKAGRSSRSGWTSKNHGHNLDRLCLSIMAAARTKFGSDSVIRAADSQDRIFGIPVPSLALEYLLQLSSFPLGLVTQIVGEPMTSKSSFLYEIFRWFRMAGGIGTLMEHETKFSPYLFRSIVNWNKHAVWPVRCEDKWDCMVHTCNSIEDWQEATQHYIKESKRLCIGKKSEPGPGRTIPWAYGIDSLLGKASRETQNKVRESGSAGRSHPVEQLSIKTFMQTIPQDISGWPFSLFSTNHLKPRKDDNGISQDHVPGGSAVHFQETFRLRMRHRKQLSSSIWEGKVLEIKTTKNSMGPANRAILTRMLWKDEMKVEEKTGRKRGQQATWWDWHWSTVDMLLKLQGPAKKHVDEVLHIVPGKTGDATATASAKELGVSAKDPVSWSAMGKLIAENAEIMDALRGALSIRTVPIFKPTVEYQQSLLSPAGADDDAPRSAKAPGRNSKRVASQVVEEL